jgi:hypothetical protein
MNGLALILGGWAIVMLVTMVAMPRKAADTEAVKGPNPVQTAPAAAAPPRADAPARSLPAATTPVAARTELPAPPGDELGLTVAFVAERDCWISVTSDDGAPSDRILRASERYVVRAREVVSFKAGNAAALSMLINDQPASPLGGEGQVVARRITKTNYRSLLQS